MGHFITIQKQDYIRLKSYFQKYEAPFIRSAQPGDTVLYVGVAVILSESTEERYYASTEPFRLYADYYEDKKEVLDTCRKAKKILQKNLPALSIHVDGTEVFSLGEDFKDLDGLVVKTITFPRILSVSLVQQYFDDHKIPIVFAPVDDYWSQTVHEVDELRNQHDLPEHLQSMMARERLPIGADLCQVLQEWYPYSINYTHRGTYLQSVFRFMGWAIGGRVLQVLEYLDNSAESLNKKVAFRIREIGTWDRSGGGMAAVMADGFYGWLGRELGNLTWSRENPDWYKSCGDSRRALDRRYPEVFRNKITEGEGFEGIDDLVKYVGTSKKLFQRVYDVILDSDNPGHRIRAMLVIRRLVERSPGLMYANIDNILTFNFSDEPVEVTREVFRMFPLLNLNMAQRNKAIFKLCLFLKIINDRELGILAIKGLIELCDKECRLPCEIENVITELAGGSDFETAVCARQSLDCLCFWHGPAKSVEEFLNRSAFHSARKEIEFAFIYLDDGIQFDENDERLWFERCRVCFDGLGNNDEALECLKHVHTVDGSVSGKILYQAVINHFNQDYKTALALFDQVKVSELTLKRQIQFHACRGLSQEAYGLKASARNSYNQAQKLIPPERASEDGILYYSKIVTEKLAVPPRKHIIFPGGVEGHA